MTTKFFAVLTNQGAAKLANATALGTQLQITHMAVGDGGGVLPLPNAAQTQLIGEKRRAALNSLSVDAANSSQIIAEQVIPETDGGWWIREIGLFDSNGILIAIANCPETYKPQLQEGSGRTQTVRMVLIVSSTEAVTLKIDPSVVLATRKYVDDKVIEVRGYADGLFDAHLAATDPHTQYAPKASPSLTGKPLAPTAVKTDNSTQLATTAHVKLVVADYAPIASPTLTGTPLAPTAATGSNTQQLANTAFVQAAISALVSSSPAALDTLNELAAALGNDPNFATTMTNALAAKMDKAKNGSDIPNVADFLTSLGLTGIGIGLPSMTGIDNFDFQTFVFTSGANYIASSTNWINVPTEISYPAGLAISIRVDYVTGTQIGLEIKPSTVSSSNFRAWYVRLGGYPGSRTFTAREIQTSANPVPISGGGTGATTAAGALTALGLTNIGIGLLNQSDIPNFDWQNFVFTAGANYVTTYNTWVNPPAGITYNAGTRVSIRVIYISTTNGPRMGLELTPDTGSSTNFKVYKLLCTGAAGSRVFTFNQDWNSANPIPVAGGGTGATTVAGAIANLDLGDVAHLPQLTGIVGTSRNARISIPVTLATASFTADELIVQTALGGYQYKLCNINKTINLAASGAGGMDTGTVPISGYVALYVIYNPTANVSALLAVNTTSTLAPEICSGVMPTGYTASALVSVWRIVASKFIPGEQVERSISIQSTTAFTITANTPATTIASISSIVPPNTKRISGIVNILIATAGGGNYTEFNLFSSASSVGRQSARYGAPSIGDMNCNYSINVNGQNVYYSALSASGSLTASAYISKYEF